MQALTRLLVSLAVYGAVSLYAMSSWAAYSITNGGFDAQDATVNDNPTITPTGWFNSSNAASSFSDNLLNVRSGSNGAISDAGGTSQGMWDANGLALGRDLVNGVFDNTGAGELGYVYQQIGTYSGEASLGVTGFVFNRTGPANQPGNFDVSIYYTSPGGFTPAVGNDIGFSGTLVGAKQVFAQGTDFTITTGTTAEQHLGRIRDVRRIWNHQRCGRLARIGDGGNPDNLTLFDEPVIDNVNISGCGMGDVNCDGHADLATDFTAIRNNFRKTGVTRAQGDLDGSGTVNLLDYLQWRRAFLPVAAVQLTFRRLPECPNLPASCSA